MAFSCNQSKLVRKLNERNMPYEIACVMCQNFQIKKNPTFFYILPQK